jgi:hypothetical protein
MRYDPNNPDSIAWLRDALVRVLPNNPAVQRTQARVAAQTFARLDPATIKALRIYQVHNKLSNTGQPDDATIQKLETDIAKLDQS